ncbi:hypothetical protein H0H81_009520 [Sphagnurus paluster]|uniref:Uncharacterized protein n=1 Tax=Sphagnurus paluster TaxID=117069 RepID=A0A9P7FS16_9AGAR|nr:hypothetical protein H0H81_009520 [Sphagnurus paluster]
MFNFKALSAATFLATLLSASAAPIYTVTESPISTQTVTVRELGDPTTTIFGGIPTFVSEEESEGVETITITNTFTAPDSEPTAFKRATVTVRELGDPTTTIFGGIPTFVSEDESEGVETITITNTFSVPDSKPTAFTGGLARRMVRVRT